MTAKGSVKTLRLAADLMHIVFADLSIVFISKSKQHSAHGKSRLRCKYNLY